MIRRAHEQRWPLVMKAECTSRSAAASTLVGSQIIRGLLPPISSAKITSGRPANIAWIAVPVVAEPVNKTPSIPGAANKAAPVSRPPITTFKTPAGRPASSNASTINVETVGANSEGLNTTVLPAKRAGTMWPLGKWPGKLKGPKTAMTPQGRCSNAVVPKAVGSDFVPVRSS